MVSRLIVLVSSGNSLEMHIPRPHPRSPESEAQGAGGGGGQGPVVCVLTALHVIGIHASLRSPDPDLSVFNPGSTPG